MQVDISRLLHASVTSAVPFNVTLKHRSTISGDSVFVILITSQVSDNRIIDVTEIGLKCYSEKKTYMLFSRLTVAAALRKIRDNKFLQALGKLSIDVVSNMR